MNIFSEIKEASKAFVLKSILSSKSLKDKYNWDNCDVSTNGELFLIEKYAPEWKVCIDIGANTGAYAANILKYNPQCRVICFEPNKQLIAEISKKGILEVHNCAVSNSIGHMKMNMNIQDPSQSSIHRAAKEGYVTEVETTTIDEFLTINKLESISFIKIDTEGHEFQVLSGARQSLSNSKIDMIQFEYGGTFQDAGTTLEEIYGLLRDRYIVCHLFPTGLLPVKYSQEIETYRYSNWIAISRKIVV